MQSDRMEVLFDGVLPIKVKDGVILVETRIEVLRAANRLDVRVDMSEVERQSRVYYSKAIADGSQEVIHYEYVHGIRLSQTGDSL